MADVFISYSRPHRHLTEELARDLESKGLTVWWDTELLAGESFRQRIQDELKACKAAVVIWTPEAVSSDYVLSEAERARMAKKLIQVRSSDLEPHDLPPPFDTSHVPLIDDRRSIYGGLARLGLMKGYTPDPGTPTALFAGAAVKKGGWSIGGRAGIVSILLLFALGSAGFSFYRGSQVRPSVQAASDMSEAELKTRAVAITNSFFQSLNSGLQDTRIFASEVRLSRRGLMSKVDAVAELRKLQAANTRVSCKADPATLTIKRAEKTPDGFRAIAVAYCDLTPAGAPPVTEKFDIEIEAARIGGSDIVTGLWQTDKMVLWKGR